MLRGITVLDLSRVLAGPYATCMLRSMGARVIKVELPLVGDETRHWGPPFVHGPDGAKLSSYFSCINFGKESVAMNIANPKGKEALLRLVKHCDAVLENFVPGNLASKGVGAQDMLETNPDVVVASISGYG